MENEPMEMSFRKDSLDVLQLHTDMMKLHYRVLACHCETLGMISENMVSATLNVMPKFNQDDFNRVLLKWGIVDLNFKPII